MCVYRGIENNVFSTVSFWNLIRWVGSVSNRCALFSNFSLFFVNRAHDSDFSKKNLLVPTFVDVKQDGRCGEAVEEIASRLKTKNIF
jgi:hypothetical protein